MNRKLSKSIVGGIFGAAMFATAMAPAGAQSRAVRAEVARLGSLYAAATPGSPAQFRIHEELDKLQSQDVPSPADFRLAEESSD